METRSRREWARSFDLRIIAYAGNLIPINTFDPIAAELLKRYPNPTGAGAANNFTRIGTETRIKINSTLASIIASRSGTRSTGAIHSPRISLRR